MSVAVVLHMERDGKPRSTRDIGRTRMKRPHVMKTDLPFLELDRPDRLGRNVATDPTGDRTQFLVVEAAYMIGFGPEMAAFDDAQGPVVDAGIGHRDPSRQHPVRRAGRPVGAVGVPADG